MMCRGVSTISIYWLWNISLSSIIVSVISSGSVTLSVPEISVLPSETIIGCMAFSVAVETSYGV